MAIKMMGKQVNGKELANLAIGTMRWNGAETVKSIIDECVKENVLFLDTSPCYCYSSEEENSEVWVGKAIENIRDKVILSSKCSPGNGGIDIGEFSERGFSVQTESNLRRMMEDQMRRMRTDYFDIYSMWSVTSDKVYDSAFKKGGWFEGAMKAKEEGLFKHLGITGHPDNKLMKRWVDDGIFDFMTVPFNILDNSRLEGIQYALSKGITVIAMNPLAGGLLGGGSEKIAQRFKDTGISNPAELSFKYVEAFGLISLCGFTELSQVQENIGYLSGEKWSEEQAIEAANTILEMTGKTEHLCTGCGYCKPCPQGINIPEVLRMRNYHYLLGLETATRDLKNRGGWDNGFKLENCTQCKACDKKCPNKLPTHELIQDALKLSKE